MTRTQNKTFLDFIAYMQIIGIILVVLGHSFHEFPDGRHGTSMLLYRLCYSFHMPLFLFVSGFLMAFSTEMSGKKRSPSKFIISKVKRLLLPMIVLTVITFVPRAKMSFAADEVISLNSHNFIMSFIDSSYMPIPFFWFLHVSFLLLCGCFLIIYVFKKIKIPPLVTLIIIFIILLYYALSSLPSTTILSLSQLKQMGFFFVIGAVYALCSERIDRYIPWEKIWFFVLTFMLWLVSFFLLEHTMTFYICSLMGIVTSISISKILVRRQWKFLDHLKGANFIIFLLSWYCNVFFQQFLAHFFSLPWWIHTLLSLISGIYIPWLGYKYLERHQDSKWIRLTSTLLGQSFKK